MRDDISREIIGEGREEDTGNHVRPQQTLKGDTRREHGNDLRVTRQLCSEEDDGNEDEERTEEVGKIRNEVRVIVEDNGAQRCVILREFCEVLIDIEDDRDRDNQRNREEISPYKLLDDIPVYPFDVPEGIEVFENTKEA